MSEIKQRIFAVRPSLIRNIGIILFVLAFIVPPGSAHFVPTMDEHFRDYLQPFWGCRVFIYTPPMLFFMPLFRDPDDGFTPYEIFIRVVMMGAWLTNFTVFFRLPRLAALIAVILPWASLACWFAAIAGFVPFYFWALGITLIHLSRILKSWPNTALEPAGVGAISSASRSTSQPAGGSAFG